MEVLANIACQASNTTMPMLIAQLNMDAVAMVLPRPQLQCETARGLACACLSKRSLLFWQSQLTCGV